MADYRLKADMNEKRDYPPILKACHIMEITGFTAGEAYELMRSEACPIIRPGKRLTAPRDLFWQFLLSKSRSDKV